MAWLEVGEGIGRAMAKLVNAQTKKEHELAGDEVVVGRHPSCDVVVLEKQVSRIHCRLVHTQEGWLLSDAGSILGTFLNNELLMQPQCLQDGDEVKVGSQAFVYTERGDRRPKAKLRPISEASPEELVPFDIPGRLRPKRRPVLLGLLVAIAAVGTLIAVVLMGRQTPGEAVRNAAQLLRTRATRQLWMMLTDERRQALSFDEFQDQVRALPDDALESLESLTLGNPYRAERGMVVPLYVRYRGGQLSDEIVLVREGGEWRIHSTPTRWFNGFSP